MAVLRSACRDLTITAFFSAIRCYVHVPSTTDRMCLRTSRGKHGYHVAFSYCLSERRSEPRSHRSTQATYSVVWDPNWLMVFSVLEFVFCHHVNLDIPLAVDMHLIFILCNIHRVYMYLTLIYRSP